MDLKICVGFVLLPFVCLGCHDPITNDQAIIEVRKCEAAGMRAVREVNDRGETLAIYCVPKDEK